MFTAVNTCKILTCVAETKPVHAEETQQNRVDERVDKIMPSVPDKQSPQEIHNDNYWLLVKVLRPTQHKIGHFEDVPQSQPLGLVWKNKT